MGNKLELTWYGKEKEIKVEPRILIEDKEKSNIKNDPNTENMIIHGDNLLALKALESKYAGQVKCIYIDPPYNTGSAFEHYDDNLEHSTWLSLMRPRLEILRNLLDDCGSIWISIDDEEAHYLKILCDETYSRYNFIADIAWEKADSPRMDADLFSTRYDHILVYAKNKDKFKVNRIKPNYVPNHYNKMDEFGNKYYLKPLRYMGNQDRQEDRPNMYFGIDSPDGTKIYPVRKDGSNGRWRWSKERLEKDYEKLEFIKTKNGWSVNTKIFYKDNEGTPPETMWFFNETGSNRIAKAEITKIFDGDKSFETPKPELLIERILTIATNEGDLVLDSFLGSGTTAAVAHKMNRRYIGVELGDHAYTHCKVRLDKVISGEDQGGISISKEYYDLKEDDLKDLDLDIEEVKSFNKILNKIGKETDLIPKDILKEIKSKTRTQRIKSELIWQGGGAYRFYELAPSLINEDDFGEYVINKDYNADMLAAAVALHEGFEYNPDSEIFWKQSKANESSYLFVTTRHLNEPYLDSIISTMEENEYLIIACKSFDGEIENKYPNITIKKIPQMLLSKCEFDRDNYNLNIINPPIYENSDEYEEEDDE